MVADAADAVISYWKSIVDPQMAGGTPFAAALKQKQDKDIPFKVRVITSETDHALRPLEAKLLKFLSDYGFDVALEKGVNPTPSGVFDFEGADLLVVLPFSSDVAEFCIDFGSDQARASRMVVCVPDGEDGKYYCRKVRESYGVQTLRMPAAELSEGSPCRLGVDIVKLCADNLMRKVAATLRKLRIEKTVVVLIHGIRTRAEWQAKVGSALRKAQLVPFPTNYSKFDIVRFLLPFERLRQAPVRRIDAAVRSARRSFPEAQVCLLAHSFGSYIVGKLLSSGDHDFGRVALCGSVLPDHFDFDAVRTHFTEIINEIGCRDILPSLAGRISGYGPSGSFGFRNGHVVDRKHADAGHSSFLTAEFCERFWVPFFCDGNCDDYGDVAANPSRMVRFFDGTIFAWIFWSVVLAGAAVVLFLLAKTTWFLVSIGFRMLGIL